MAAIVVPDGTARAFVGDNGLASGRVDGDDQRDTEALAHALLAVPDVVDGARLDVAGALAINGVPVEGVIGAGLGSADPLAGVGVPGVNDAGRAISVGGLEGADAFTKLVVPVVVGIFADVADSELAVVHVPVLTSWGLLWSKAAASAGRGVKEEAFIAILVFALAAASDGVPFVADSAQLLDAAALASLDVPVEANWASAVFGEALAGSGVEVLAVSALEWAAEAAASDHVEVLGGRARRLGVLSADAIADVRVVSGVNELAVA